MREGIIKLLTLFLVLITLLACLFYGREAWVVQLTFCTSVLLFGIHYTHISLTRNDLLLLLFPLFIIATLIPLPEFLGPQQSEYHNQANQIIEEVRIVLDTQYQVSTESIDDNAVKWAPISLNTSGSLRVLLAVVFSILIFWVCRSINPIIPLIFVFIFLLINTTTGLISYFLFPQEKTVLWITPVLFGNPVGAFVNPNHYAFSNLLLIGNGLAIIHILKDARPSTKYTLLSLCLILGIAGLLISASRGAIVAAVVGAGSCMLYLVSRKSLKSLGYAGLVLMIFFWVMVFAPVQKLSDKVESLSDPLNTLSAQTRISSWKDALSLWADYPIIGSGAESFRAVFPIYQTINSRRSFVYAENEYVQALCEIGIIGLGILVLLFWKTGASMIKNLQLNKNSFIPFIWICGITATHCALDFPLRHPLNSISLVLLFASLANSDTYKDAWTYIPPKSYDFFKKPLLIILIITAFAITVLGTNIITKDTRESFAEGTIEQSMAAIEAAPTYPGAWRFLGLKLIELTNSPDFSLQQKQQLSVLAIESLKKAAEYNASNYQSWVILAEAQASLGRDEDALKSATKAVGLRSYLEKTLKNIFKKQE